MSDVFQEVFDASDGFSRPYLKPDVAHPYHPDMLRECFMSLARAHGSKISRHCRIFAAGRLLTPFEAKDVVRAVAAFSDLAMCGWNDLFGEDDFLIFLNMAGRYSPSLASASRAYLGSFDRRFEPSGVSIEHHLIVGRYDETPFGVHIDDATDRVFHFNLGPAAKSMTLWPRRAFRERYDHDSAKPWASVDGEGSATFAMPAGSCFLLPADFYHVGSSRSGVSAVISLAFSRQSERLMLRSAFEELQNLVPRREREERYYADFLASPPLAGAEALTHYDGVGLAAASDHAQARRRSSNGFVDVPPLRIPEIAALEGRYRLCDPSSLQTVSADGQLHVYSGGHHARLRIASQIDDFRAVLSSRRFTISCAGLAGRSAEKNALIALLGWLVGTGSAVRETGAA